MFFTVFDSFLHINYDNNWFLSSNGKLFNVKSFRCNKVLLIKISLLYIIIFRIAFYIVLICQIISLLITLIIANYDCVISNWATFFLISSLSLYEIFDFLHISNMESCKSWSKSFEIYLESIYYKKMVIY